MKITVLAAIIILAAGHALTGERVEYHRFGGNTYGSDGSRSHEFNGTTTISRPGPPTCDATNSAAARTANR